MKKVSNPQAIVKTFSATKFDERNHLGEVVTQWIRTQEWAASPEIRTLQSSDQSYHCLSFVIIGVVFTRQEAA